MTESVSDVNAEAFVTRYGGVYEHSPWVAERTLARGALPPELAVGHGPAAVPRDRGEVRRLAGAMAETLAAASAEEQRALILAHPDLVGRAALAGDLTDESTTEQSSAGLDSCTAEELERFRTLNAAYRERFGFPFVMAVRGRDRSAILDAFETRLDNDVDTEFATALREIDRIAMLRLEALAGRD